VAYLACVTLELGKRAVGEAIRRHRTTIGHALAEVEDRRDDPVYDAWLGTLEERALAI
jgi:hypothetical protein